MEWREIVCIYIGEAIYGLVMYVLYKWTMRR